MKPTEIDMAKAGEFLREYGKQYFVVVSEALNIGRVKWNMVPIGKKGQDGIDFYLATEQMVALCQEIQSGRFEKKLANDTGNYPAAYKYVTGNDGSLNLNIGGGKVGCRVQMMNKATKLNYTMAVSIDAMKDMARKFLLCVGLTPVMSKTYYASVIKAFEDGRVEKAKFRKAPEELYDVVDANAVAEHDNEPMDAVKPPYNKEVNEKPETNLNTGDQVYHLVVKGDKETKKGFYVFPATTDNNENVSVMFRIIDASDLSWFAKMEEKAKKDGAKIAVIGERKNEYILFKGIAGN